MTFPRFGDSRAKSGAAVPLGFSSAARLRHSPSYPPVLSRNLVRSESNQEALRWLSSTGRNRSRRRYEQSEPTEASNRAARTSRANSRAAADSRNQASNSRSPERADSKAVRAGSARADKSTTAKRFEAVLP